MLPIEVEDIPRDNLCVYIDEVGRGAGSGPVVACAIVFKQDYCPETADEVKLADMVKDSKKLSAKNRDKLAEYIKHNAVAWSVGIIDNEEIDKINILQATFRAMHAALDGIGEAFDRIIVDGNRFKPYMNVNGEFVPHKCIVNGDALNFGIAAASIVAKVTRDKIMEELHDNNIQCQVYNWKKNKGYLTAEHTKAIRENGLSVYHRKTFIH